ncbi:phage major capsid protein [Streptomyces maoxianensis]|uniref:Phage major capsid protein n=1 Tax=Streptomyces maoxianensis TaxID=1459942 RepID=A0ABV9G888_9ACTN
MPKRTLPATREALETKYATCRNSSGWNHRALLHKRHSFQTEARSLLDAATARGQQLTDKETEAFDRLMADRDELDGLILESGDEIERAREEVDDPGRGRRAAAPGVCFTTADGRTVRGAGRGESFARIAGGRGRGGERNGPGPDTSDLSLGRAVMGMITGDRDVMERELRAQVVGQDPAGGYFVTPALSALFVDQARARSVLVEAGAVTIPLGSAETRILRVTQSPTAAWKSELGALANTDIRFGSVTLFPKVLGCVVDISEELVEDGANAPQQIEAVMAQAVADQLDRSFFRGMTSGTGGNDVVGRYFTGVLDDPDVNTLDMAGAPPTDYDELIDAMQLVEDNNGMADVRIESPRTAAQLAKLKSATEGLYISPPPSVAALRHLKTTQVPTTLGAGNDESVSVVGNFADAFVIIGIRSAFRVEVSREAGDAWENLGRKVRIWGRADMAIGRPSHLALIQAIGPTP